MTTNQCCRGCFELSDLLSIFTDYGNGKIVDLIEYCVGIKVLESDPFPQLICSSCLEKLEGAEEIKRKFLESDVQLKELIKADIKQEDEEDHHFEDYLSYEQSFQEEEMKSENNEKTVKSEDQNFIWPAEDSKKHKKAKRKNDEKMGNKTTRCQICKLQCHSRSELRDHNMEAHSKILTCEMCNQQMSSKDTFRKHMRTHIENNDQPLHVCNCGEKFYLTRHFVIHKCPIKPICYLCNLTFTCRKEILRHIEEAHCEEDSYACKETDCKFKTKRSETYFYHMAGHFDPIERLCEICSQTFTDLRIYHAHKLKHKKVTTRYYCDLCGLRVLRKANLIRHFRSSHIKTRFPCDSCNRIYTDPAVLKQHKVSKHGLEAEWICEVCDQKFIYNSMLRNHQKLHSKGYRFKQRRNAEEKKNMIFECVACQKNFANEANLKRHKDIVHLKIKKYQCSHCQKPFSQKSSLETHTRIHTGEKPFACQWCTSRYSDRSTLHKHLKNIHKEQKPVIQVILSH